MIVVIVAQHSRVVDQLAMTKMVQFPAIITKKYTCDVTVIVALRGWTLDTSSTALLDRILEQHTEEWMKKQLVYYGECQLYRCDFFKIILVPLFKSEGLTGQWLQGTPPVFNQPIPMETIPCARYESLVS